MSKMIVKGGKIKRTSNQYDLKQKAKLIELGNSNKTYREILKYLKNEIARSTEVINFNYRIECFKEDGAYQLNRAVEEIYGASNNQGDKKPSGGKENVLMINVELADGTNVKVPYGDIALPELGESAMIRIGYDNAGDTLIVQGSCEFQYQTLMDEIIAYTKHLLNTESIYKSQAFELTKSTFTPQYMNLSNIDKEFMVLSDKTKRELKPLTARILEPEKCVSNGIPLKYGCLLEGPYGTGKTLAAFKIAKQAIENNWIFIYLKEPTLLARTLKLSKSLDKNGHGVIVFVEDIDQVTSGNRDSAMQNILNTIDGGDTKHMNVIALFTTNHLERIEPTFLRGKRIGSIIQFGYLDAPTTRLFLEEAFDASYDVEQEGMDEVCKYVEENNIAPAFMAEICESVKTHMIFEESNVIKPQYIRDSIDNYLRQVALSQTKDMSETTEMKFASSLSSIVKDALSPMKADILYAVMEQEYPKAD